MKKLDVANGPVKNAEEDFRQSQDFCFTFAKSVNVVIVPTVLTK
jgi:hypothetical protein